MKKCLFQVCFCLVWAATLLSQPALLPLPQHVSWHNKPFIWSKKIQLRAEGLAFENIAVVSEFVKTMTDHAVKSAANDLVVYRLHDAKWATVHPQEAYTLEVSPHHIKIAAVSETGLYWAIQTLRQLTEGQQTQGCSIQDFPAFSMRGFMHDVGRSFIGFESLKQQIALLSQYKINVFHWHLTEDLAWRLESKVEPRLNAPSTFNRFEGQFYTQAQARELVDWCKQHQVLLIPELDMPGHSAAFQRATGLEMQTPAGKVLVKALLREFCAIFDVPFIHLGTDEVAFKDPTFLSEMSQIVRDCGKEVIGWLPGGTLDKQAIRQLWTSKPKPRQGLRVIDSRNYYLNHFDPMADLVGVYNRAVCDTSVGSAERLGAIACIWNDRKLNNETDMLLSNGFYPIMLALAERAWRGGGQLENQVGVQMQPDFYAFENRLLAHKKRHFNKLPFPYVRQQQVHWHVIKPFDNQGNLSQVFPPEQGNFNFETTAANGASIYLRHVWGDIVPSHFKHPTPNATAYAYTYIFSPKQQKVGLWLNFHNYGRSEKDATPPIGKWDYKESRAWLNSYTIEPPNWKNAGQHPSHHEVPLEDEPCEMRPPTPIVLKKGWNLLLLKLPVGTFNTPTTRLVKWFFTAVCVQQAGVNVEAVEGLIYSPQKVKKTSKKITAYHE